MLAGQSFSLQPSEVFAYPNNEFIPKRKRKPAGTPDPDAEVVYLSPEMLMESDRYVCEICNQSFQREQNLQMHRRRHKVPWKLLKREKQEVKKRVYVCPEPTCPHHDPGAALGDLVGIKKHFRRKHSNHKQWVCEKCSKGYAVQSDYKAHIKICGTRGHSCDCGRVFSRVEAFIEHQDACKDRMRNYVPLAGTTTEDFGHSSFRSGFLRDPSFISPVNDGVLGQKKFDSTYEGGNSNGISNFCHNLELELFTSSCTLNSINLSVNVCATPKPQYSSQLGNEGKQVISCQNNSWKHNADNEDIEELPEEAFRLRLEAKELSRIAMEQNKVAEEKKKEAKCLFGLAMQEMNKAQRIREEALAEFHAAQALKECSTRKINSNVLQIKCKGCRKDFLTLSQGSYAEPYSASSSFPSTIQLEPQEGNSNFMLCTRYP